MHFKHSRSAVEIICTLYITRTTKAEIHSHKSFSFLRVISDGFHWLRSLLEISSGSFKSTCVTFKTSSDEQVEQTDLANNHRNATPTH